MKKYIFALSALTLAFCLSCKKTEPTPEEGINDGNVILGARMEAVKTGNTGNAKTTIGEVEGKKYAVWSSGDEILAFGNNGNSRLVAVDISDLYAQFVTAKGQEDPGTVNYVLYPYQEGATIDGSTITFNIPATQKYRKDSFADGFNIAVGAVTQESEYQEANFKNVCGYFKLSLKSSSFTVKKITLFGFGYEKLNGKFQADASSSTPVATAVGERVVGDDIITLDCGNGAALNASDSTDFIFVVPVSALANGFMATVYDTKDNRINFDLVSTKSTNTIQRSFMINMPSKTIGSFPDSEYILCSSIQSEYVPVDTGINPKDGVGIAMKGTMLSTKTYVGTSLADNNGVFCGVCYKYDAPYTPWITLDWHNGQKGCRISYNGAQLYSSRKIPINEPFELN